MTPGLLGTGRGLVESRRWHDGKFWFADWTAGEILVLGAGGETEVVAHAPGGEVRRAGRRTS